jgi:hypothetical protein
MSHKTSASLELIFSDFLGSLLFFHLMVFAILFFMLMHIQNIYGITLLLQSLIFTMFFINFKLSLSVNFR